MGVPIGQRSGEGFSGIAAAYTIEIVYGSISDIAVELQKVFPYELTAQPFIVNHFEVGIKPNNNAFMRKMLLEVGGWQVSIVGGGTAGAFEK